MRDLMVTHVPQSPAPTGLQLVAIAGEDTGRIFRLDDTTTLVGRASHAGVVLANEDVSRDHARVVRTEMGYVVEDLDSTNGTFVNGERVTTRRLGIGDKLRFGIRCVLQVAAYDPIEDSLRERQRFEAVGRIGAGIAHDFKNMLGVITASVECIEHMTPQERGEEDLDQWLRDMRTAAERAGQLATRLLEASRCGAGTSQPINLSRVCIEVAQLVKRSLPREIDVVEVVAPGMRVRGDRSALYQVLMNLFVNARDAMPEGGTITLRCRRARSDQGPRVVVEIGDTGVGIDPAALHRVFEPLFTTKPPGVGFGLGLATVKETVERHGGSVKVESTVGVGTRFVLTFPLDMPNKRRMARTGDEPRNLEDARILVVDNELVLRRVYRRLLIREGYDVDVVRDGRAMLDQWEQLAEPDLILLDVDMPRLNGLDVFEELRRRRLTPRVILVTGSDTDHVRRRARELGAYDLLIKPVSAKDLLAGVRSALRRSTPPRTRNTPRLGREMIRGLHQERDSPEDD